MTLKVGGVVEGVVKGITNFGAFVELPGGQTGLVHISEVADTYVKDIRKYLNEEDKVRVKVLSIDGKKIGLSIRKVKENKEKLVSFEDKLAKFLKESDEKQKDIKKNVESKRGDRDSNAF
ncbi:S1 RNA-binding domain-containing protein [Natranaerofaba carboxydovora]|uniref:S1 RNA-binding domain-containing protein n=1 Tax=Natranaerofaba carboxydovora TaxID=2742683 RepID=UPI001F134632|nr:S1 RNA-binding domain-containing protein [Natranaerofaba carboxydovora]UMZ75283.1 General stress protein 13 [Natranaerofaba carboxydovora]